MLLLFERGFHRVSMGGKTKQRNASVDKHVALLLLTSVTSVSLAYCLRTMCRMGSRSRNTQHSYEEKKAGVCYDHRDTPHNHCATHECTKSRRLVHERTSPCGHTIRLAHSTTYHFGCISNNLRWFLMLIIFFAIALIAAVANRRNQNRDETECCADVLLALHSILERCASHAIRLDRFRWLPTWSAPVSERKPSNLFTSGASRIFKWSMTIFDG